MEPEEDFTSDVLEEFIKKFKAGELSDLGCASKLKAFLGNFLFGLHVASCHFRPLTLLFPPVILSLLLLYFHCTSVL